MTSDNVARRRFHVRFATPAVHLWESLCREALGVKQTIALPQAISGELRRVGVTMVPAKNIGEALLVEHLKSFAQAI